MPIDLTSLQKALATLDRALARFGAAPRDEELRDACIQRFESIYERAWKPLKRRLEMDLPNPQEVDGMSYRTLIRVGAEQRLIDDVTACLPEVAGHARQLLEKVQVRGEQDA